MADVYNPDDDIVAGGGSHDKTQSAGAYVPEQDTPVGVNPATASGNQPPSILKNAWKFISATGNELYDTARGAIHAFDTPENREAAGQGVIRGARNVFDKVGEYPNPEVGYTPPSEDLETVRRQNANDRAEAYKKYGDNPSFKAGTLVGETGATAPFLGPLGRGLTAGVRTLADTTALRGALGVLARVGERGAVGAPLGATQAALTSDPSQPMGPQIAGGAIMGGAFPMIAGVPADAISNAIRRLSGSTMPINSRTGAPYQTDTARADNARILLNEHVPIQASQVSEDPLLHISDKYGSQVPGSGAAPYLKNQWEQYRNRVLQRVDPTTNEANATTTPGGFVERNEAALGHDYRATIGAVPTVPAITPNGSLYQDLATIGGRIPQGLGNAEQDQIRNTIREVAEKFVNGNHQLSGPDAHLLTQSSSTTLSPLLNSTDATLRNFGRQIRGAVNDYIRPMMTPQQQTLFDQTNGRWRALQTVKDVADSNGSFDPKALNKAAADARDTFGGRGTIDDLANAGESVIQPTLDSRHSVSGGPHAVAQLSPTAAALVTSLGIKPLLGWAAGGGAGTAAGAGLAGINYANQVANRRGGPRAVNATLAGGGNPVHDLQNALALLRMPAVSLQENAQRPPLNQ